MGFGHSDATTNHDLTDRTVAIVDGIERLYVCAYGKVFCMILNMVLMQCIALGSNLSAVMVTSPSL
jgi:hypothetical protein